MIKLTITSLIILSLLIGCAQNKEMAVQDDMPLKLYDTDKDGVIDGRDTCPGTNEKVDVDNNGCPIWTQVENVSELVIFFEISSSKIDPKYMKQLEDKLEYVKGHKDTSILLEGYTSDKGSKELNHKLQQERASAVKSALISLGAKPETITVHNQGGLSEKVKVDEKQVHNANQRVYIKIIKLNEKAQEKWSFMTN